ncbi:DUF5789 family protein [Halegenticoccus tardaugens]|uniref:DUF5789 family protein n=1 Tax=Halegenticoccus tardaugens TaxID=2071624 RepID=UPI00100B4D7D|nr:DUF2795 domain-containing protein [Halegenticoccus tardaugens]
MRLNRTADAFDGHEYPMTSEELIEAYGDRVIELQNGEERFGAVLERLGSQTYENPEDVRDALFTCVSHRAIGRRFYSDRDPFSFGEYGPEPLSF